MSDAPPNYPVWEFVNDDVHEMLVRPVTDIPVSNTTGRIVAAMFQLANGGTAQGLLGTLNTANLRSTQHFLLASIERGGEWFHLARYHDHDYAQRGPTGLATFLGLQVDDVFPICYDISHLVVGERRVSAGVIALALE